MVNNWKEISDLKKWDFTWFRTKKGLQHSLQRVIEDFSLGLRVGGGEGVSLKALQGTSPISLVKQIICLNKGFLILQNLEKVWVFRGKYDLS